MIDSDLAQFTDILDSLSDYYQKDPLKPMAVKIYFRALAGYSLAQIGEGVNAHLTGKWGHRFPLASDISDHIEGGTITADMIVAAAKLAETPLGCLARIHIGTWDLNNQDSFYLRQRAEECLQKLPEWKARAQAGEYTDHEMSVLLKYEIRPDAPFCLGAISPANSQQLLERAKRIEESPRHQAFIEPPYQGDNEKSGEMHPDIKALIHSKESE